VNVCACMCVHTQQRVPEKTHATGAEGCFAMLMFCNNRPQLLEQTLDSLFTVRGVLVDKLVASQDGSNPAVAAVLAQRGIVHFEHAKKPMGAIGKKKEGAALIAEHYKWAVDKAFGHFGESAAHLVIIEDDMLFAPDFMQLFIQLAPLLERDPTLWTISAFADNGFSGMVFDETRVIRTEWTVGFGWLLRRRLWEDELRHQWPKTHWDHWLRSDKRRRGRETLFPEVSRDYHTGVKGTHSEPGQFDRYFRNIRLAAQQSPLLMGGDLDQLVSANYEEATRQLVAAATPVRNLSDLEALALDISTAQAPPLVLCYESANASDKAWQPVATYFGLWHTSPIRGEHRGLVRTGHRGRSLLLIASWSPYSKLLPAGTPRLTGAHFIEHGAVSRLSVGWLARAKTPSTSVLNSPPDATTDIGPTGLLRRELAAA